MPTVGAVGWSLFADNKLFAAGTTAARKNLRSLKGDLVSLKDVTRGLTSVMGAFGVTLTGAAVVGGIKAMVSESMEAIDTTAKLSDRLGVATERLTGLRPAASLAGVDTASFDKDLDMLAKRLGQITAMGGRDINLLKSFGLDPGKLAGMAPDQAFLDIAEAISKIESPTQRAMVATKLFGRQGQELLNTLMQGREALEEQIAAAEKLGIAYSRVDAAQVEAANDAWDRMKSAVGGVANKIAIDLAPAVEQLAKSMEGVVSGVENAEKAARTPEQEKLIEESGRTSLHLGTALLTMSNVASDIDKRNQEFAWLQNLQNTPSIAGNQVVPMEGGGPSEAMLAAQEAGEKFVKHLQFQVDTFGMASDAVQLLKLRIDGATKADIERAQALIDQKQQLEDAVRRQRETEKAEQDAQRAREDRMRDVRNLEDSLKSPAEKLRDEAGDLLALFADSAMSPDTLKRAGDAIAKRAEALEPTAVTAQSTGAIRAGSVEALRAQFTGQKIEEKNLEEQKKHTSALADVKTLLGQIRDAASGISDGSAL